MPIFDLCDLNLDGSYCSNMHALLQADVQSCTSPVGCRSVLVAKYFCMCVCVITYALGSYADAHAREWRVV